MNGADLFHTGIVVEDFEGTLARLSELAGYEWCAEIGGPTPVRLPTGDTELELRFAYSRTVPRLEIIRPVPGSLWMPAAGSGIHHLGYWSDDVAGDAAELERLGFVTEATGLQPDGTPYWAYHRDPGGYRIELVARSLQPMMEQYWSA